MTPAITEYVCEGFRVRFVPYGEWLEGPECVPCIPGWYIEFEDGEGGYLLDTEGPFVGPLEAALVGDQYMEGGFESSAEFFVIVF